MNEIVLRTMTLKSVLHTGKYEGCTVGQVMATDMQYLLWLYYHNERCSFTDEVMAQLHIPENLRIKKPGVGTSNDLCLWWKHICKHLPHDEYIKIVAMMKKSKRIQSNRIRIKIETTKKSVYQSYNLKRMKP